MKKFIPYRRERIIGLNNDREDAFWQEERGERYGNNRKGIAKDKIRKRRDERIDFKRDTTRNIKEL